MLSQHGTTVFWLLTQWCEKRLWDCKHGLMDWRGREKEKEKKRTIHDPRMWWSHSANSPLVKPFMLVYSRLVTVLYIPVLCWEATTPVEPGFFRHPPPCHSTPTPPPFFILLASCFVCPTPIFFKKFYFVNFLSCLCLFEARDLPGYHFSRR